MGYFTTTANAKFCMNTVVKISNNCVASNVLLHDWTRATTDGSGDLDVRRPEAIQLRAHPLKAIPTSFCY